MKKGRQAAFSHWLGPHSSRALHLRERQGQNEKWLVRGKVGSCVNMRKKMLTGASKWTLTVTWRGKKKELAINKPQREFQELKQAFFK